MFEKLRQLLSGARTDVALVEAAGRLDLAEVRRLLARGIAPDARDALGRTALMRAAAGAAHPDQRGEVIAAVLAARADVDAVDSAGQTALIHAACAGAVSSALQLVAAGADLRVRALSGLDPLAIAVRHGHRELAQALASAELARSADPRALLCAALTGDVDRVARALASGERGDGEGGPTPLHAAAFAGHLGVATALLDAGAEVDAADDEGVTPLIVAARMGHAGVVRELARRGADLARRTAASAHGDDAIAIAARHGHREVVAALLDAGVDPAARGRGGSLLAIAARAGDEAIVALALARGAHVDGPAPLCAAAAAGSAAIVDRLLAAGADPSARVEMPRHGISLAPLTNAIAANAPDVVARLVEAGADVNAREPSGDTLLVLLAEMTADGDDQLAIARTLLGAGVDVNAGASPDRTAVAVAEQRGLTRLVTLLRGAGARAR